MAEVTDFKDKKISELTVEEYRNLFFPREEKYYSVKDLCTRYGVTSMTIYNWMSLGKLSFKRVGDRKVVFSEADLKALEVQHGYIPERR